MKCTVMIWRLWVWTPVWTWGAKYFCLFLSKSYLNQKYFNSFLFLMVFKCSLDTSTTHPKFDSKGLRTHELQTLVLTTEPSGSASQLIRLAMSSHLWVPHQWSTRQIISMPRSENNRPQHNRWSTCLWDLVNRLVVYRVVVHMTDMYKWHALRKKPLSTR